MCDVRVGELLVVIIPTEHEAYKCMTLPNIIYIFSSLHRYTPYAVITQV